jgi:hypothetical protein
MDTSSGHQDVYVQSPWATGPDGGYVEIGLRLDWGGSVIFFGLPGSNVIDAHDTGRGLQVATFDASRMFQPCAATASCAGVSASTCGAGSAFLGWNPVQAGNRCGTGSGATLQQTTTWVQATATPLQWNPDWQSANCTSNCTGLAVHGGVSDLLKVRFLAPAVVELSLQVIDLDSLDHTGAPQDFPRLFVANGVDGGEDLSLLFDSAGNAVPLPPDGGPMLFSSPGPYVIWQDAAEDYGVGLASDESLTQFQAFADDDVPFRSVRADARFPLGADAIVRGRAFLGVGDLASVQGQLGSVLALRPPFGSLDEPANSTTTDYDAGQPVYVQGWALGSSAISAVEIQIDGADAGLLPLQASRPDVCMQYPNYPGCPTPAAPMAQAQVGFSGYVPTTGLSSCPHLLAAFATDANGNTIELGEAVIAAQ